MTHRFVVIGDVMFDVTSRGSEGTQSSPDIPARNTMQPGGGGANIAVWLTFLSQHVQLYAHVGEDLAGQTLAEALHTRGVQCTFTRSASASTGTCVIVVGDSGERFMRSDPGANAELALPNIAAVHTDHVHMSAYALRSASVASRLGTFTQEAKDRSITTSLDLSATYIVDHYGPVLQNCLWDVVFGTREEFSALPEPISAVSVVKAGASGVEVLEGNNRQLQAAPDLEPLDTTGAGDAYAAGFLSAWVTSGDIAAGMEAARDAARIALGRVGAWPPPPLPAR